MSQEKITNPIENPHETTTTANRRQLKTRDTKMAIHVAKWLSLRNITPNQISMLSIVCASLAAVCLITNFTPYWLSPILAAVFIQCRLLCNLLDGMVAIEGGKKTVSGELFNDIPDRIADILIFVAAGYCIDVVSWGIELGWCAALLAVMTAYVRTLVTSVGAPTSFKGPMAKQHRMALMTFICVVMAFDYQHKGYIMLVGLALIIVGSLITLYRRIVAAHRFLEQNNAA